MNDDFLKNYRQEPTSAFKQALYARIAQQQEVRPRRRVTAPRVFALCCALALVFLSTPTGRAFARSILYQIGAFSVTSEARPEIEPTAAPFPAGAIQQSAEVAQASAAAGFAVREPGRIPDGYAPEGAWSISSRGSQTNVVRGYRSGSGHTITFNQSRHGPADTYVDRLSPQEEVREVEIHGQPGLIISGRLMGKEGAPAVNGSPDLEPTTWVIWAANGLNYSLWANGASADELLEMARSVQ